MNPAPGTYNTNPNNNSYNQNSNSSFNPPANNNYNPNPTATYNPTPNGNYNPTPNGNYNPTPNGNYNPTQNGNFNPTPNGNFNPATNGNFNPNGPNNYNPSLNNNNFNPNGNNTTYTPTYDFTYGYGMNGYHGHNFDEDDDDDFGFSNANGAPGTYYANANGTPGSYPVNTSNYGGGGGNGGGNRGGNGGRGGPNASNASFHLGNNGTIPNTNVITDQRANGLYNCHVNSLNCSSSFTTSSNLLYNKIGMNNHNVINTNTINTRTYTGIPLNRQILVQPGTCKGGEYDNFDSYNNYNISLNTNIFNSKKDFSGANIWASGGNVINTNQLARMTNLEDCRDGFAGAGNYEKNSDQLSLGNARDTPDIEILPISHVIFDTSCSVRESVSDGNESSGSHKAERYTIHQLFARNTREETNFHYYSITTSV